MRNTENVGRAADAVVVGGGVAGLAAARSLAARGLSVTLVERGGLGAEASSAAAGMLAPQAEADQPDALFRLLSAARDFYPDFAAELREETGVCIELDRTGTLYLAFTEEDERELEARYAWQRRAGLVVERLTAEDARRLEPSVSPRARLALRFPLDWQVENRRLVEALAASVAARGVRTLTEAATCVRVERGRVAGVETTSGFLGTGAVVIATGAWTSCLPLVRADGGEDGATFFEHPRVEPVRGQMLCFDSGPSFREVLRHVVYSPRGYLVPRRDGRILAGSTTERAGFDKFVTAEGVRSVATHALEISPAIGGLALVDMWAGLRPRAEDGWPVVGESPEVSRLFYATGHYRNGILLAPLTGELLAALVQEGQTGSSLPPGALEAFSPGRFRRTFAELNEKGAFA